MTRPASSPFPPTLREMDRDSRTAAAGTGLRRQPSFTCAGCGVELPPPKKKGHRRKWCGEPCRKRTLYGGTCVDCGAPTDGSNGRGPNAAKRCAICSTQHVVKLTIERGAAHQALIERLWVEGKTCREIGRELGWTCDPSPHIATLRRRGYDLPPRRTPEQIARITAGSAGNLAKAREVARRNRERAAA